MSESWEARMAEKHKRDEDESPRRTLHWEPVESVTLRAGSVVTIWIEGEPPGRYILLDVDRVEDDPQGGVVPRIYGHHGIALA